ncbi:MAG: carboxypeptidase-like regulatory domain-containing protein [Thermoanaerobaculia bacterium]|nr:carboxypeptidase-like regulatory domain-containing protein [Thermoanaerobaculia bacterium]
MGEVDVEVLGSDLRPAWTRIAPGAGPEIAVAAAGGAPWRIQAWAEGFWSPRIEVREPGAAVALRLWPTLSVRSELVPPRGERPPAQVRLEVTRPEDVAAEEMPLDGASIACPVVSAGEMVCAVPAGRWEVVLRAEGFVPIRLGERPLAPAGASTDLGRHELFRGIALAGQVLVETAELDPSGKRVRVQPARRSIPSGSLSPLDLSGARVRVQPARRSIPSGSLSPDLSRRHLVQEVPVDGGGHFEIEALPVGLFELVATHPGCEPAALVVELDGGEPRVRVGPIVLGPPLRLSVEIAPPNAPDGSPWRLDLLGERSGGLEQIADGIADEEGRWRSGPLAAGAYEVRVRAPGGGVLAWEETELLPGREWLQIELALVRVAGELRIGRRPFAAKLWFGGRFGEERVPVESDPDGRFEVVLPRPGAWRVDIEGISRPVRATVDGLEIEPAPPGGASEVEIDLPSTQLEGIVLDPAGNPAPEAEVLLVSLGTPPGVTFVASDAGGRFEIEGQPPGNYAAEASQGDRRSQRVEVLLAEGLRAPPLELRLAGSGRLRGRVVGPEGPVAGATIFGVPVTGWDAMASMKGELVASGPQGEFEMAVPADAARAQLIAMASGYALAVGTVAAGEGAEPVRVALVRDGGRLEIPRPPGEGGAASGLVLFGTEPLDPSLLALWARANRASAEDPEWLSVAQMPAGPYAYCELPPDALFLVFTGAALPAAGACTEGYLPAGGVLRLAPIRPPGG